MGGRRDVVASPPRPHVAERRAVWQARAVLPEGLRLRLIRPDDAPRLIALYDRLSRHAAHQRYSAPMKRLPPDGADLLANVDYQPRLALVIEHAGPTGPDVIAVGRYEP